MLAVNAGNFHTLAMHLVPADGDGAAPVRVAGILEHHTGELRRPQLARYLRELAAGTIRDEEVFATMGHGALVRARRWQTARGAGASCSRSPGRAAPCSQGTWWAVSAGRTSPSPTGT